MNLENKKQIATILLAVGLGLVAAFLTSHYVKTSIEQQTLLIAQDFKKQNDSQKAEFAKQLELRDREFGTRIAEMAKQQNEMVKQQIALAKQQTSTTVTGKAANIVDTTLFSTMTPPGKRALTIMIDSLSAVGGLVNAGDYVDIIAHLEIPKSTTDEKDTTKVTSVIFQKIQVLAVGANFRPVGSAALYQAQQQARSLNVTLAVSAEEAGLLTFAQAKGKLQLALRSPTEKGTYNLEVAAWDTLSEYVMDAQGTKLEIPSAQAKPKTSIISETVPEAAPEEYIEIFRGGREL